MENLSPKRGHVIEVDEGDYEAIGELIGFDFEEELVEPVPIIGEVWPVVIIGGDLHFDESVCSDNLANGLKGFTGKYSEGHWVVVLGNLTVNGNLHVEQYYNLMVSGTVNVHSYISHSGNFVSPSHLTARDLIVTEANEEGGVFQPGSASAKALIYTNYYFDNDWELTGEEINADELNGTDVERTRCAVFKVLDKPQEDDSLWFPLVECIEAGKVQEFLDAYEKDERVRPDGVPDHAYFDNSWYQLEETNDAGEAHGLHGRWQLDGTVIFLKRYENGKPHGEWRIQMPQLKSAYQVQHFDHGELQRPESVPKGAVWIEDEGWELKPTNDEGEKHGLVRWWRADGTLKCETPYINGLAQGSGQRYHESGEISQTYTFLDGKLHGERTWFTTTHFTTEMGIQGRPPEVVKYVLNYENGTPKNPRLYDKDGNLVEVEVRMN